MAYNRHTQSLSNGFTTHSNGTLFHRRDAAVRQVKGVLPNAPVASAQPAPRANPSRPHSLGTKVYRVNKRDTSKVKLVHTTLHLHPLVRAELERRASLEALSVSSVGASLLAAAIRQDIHSQYAGVIQPIIRQVIRDELRSLGNRLVFFLMRIAFAAEQTRILVTNILERILTREDVSTEHFHHLVDQSNQLARRNILQKTPQLKTLLADWEGLFEKEEQK
jgi:hypothetical protein